MKKANLLIIIFVVLGFGAFFFVANRFSTGEKGVESQKPITYCQTDKCYYTAHPHMELRVTQDGVVKDLGYEQGDLQKPHTHAEKNVIHAEKNVIHWHSTLSVDPHTKEVTDYSPLKLKVALMEMGINYEGKNIKVSVSSVEKQEGLEYIWQDGDKVEVFITEE
jgi:hypothetical protein